MSYTFNYFDFNNDSDYAEYQAEIENSEVTLLTNYVDHKTDNVLNLLEVTAMFSLGDRQFLSDKVVFNLTQVQFDNFDYRNIMFYHRLGRFTVKKL